MRPRRQVQAGQKTRTRCQACEYIGMHSRGQGSIPINKLIDRRFMMIYHFPTVKYASPSQQRIILEFGMTHSSATRQNRRPMKMSHVGIACLLMVTLASSLLPAFQARAISSPDILTIDNNSGSADSVAAIVEHDANRRFKHGPGLNLFFVPKIVIADWQPPADLLPSAPMPICPSNLARFRFRCKTAKDHSVSA